MNDLNKTAIITFRDGLKGSMWSYEVLVDNESMMSFSSDWDYASEDCTRYRDFSDLDNMKSLLRKVEDLARAGYTIIYN